MKLAAAQLLAEKIVAELSPYCEQIEIAGSIRRRRPEVNDIDLVVLPRDLVGLKGRCLQRATCLVHGAQNFSVALANGVKVDLWLAQPDSHDLFDQFPGNWGTLLLCRTGSKEHNIHIAKTALAQGLAWDPYRGLKCGSRIVACRTEEDIFTALKMPFIKPEDREL